MPKFTKANKRTHRTSITIALYILTYSCEHHSGIHVHKKECCADKGAVYLLNSTQYKIRWGEKKLIGDCCVSSFRPLAGKETSGVLMVKY